LSLRWETWTRRTMGKPRPGARPSSTLGPRGRALAFSPCSAWHLSLSIPPSACPSYPGPCRRTSLHLVCLAGHGRLLLRLSPHLGAATPLRRSRHRSLRARGSHPRGTTMPRPFGPAQSFTQLVLFRRPPGIGSGLFRPAILGTAATLEDKSKAFALYRSAQRAGSIVFPLVVVMAG